MRLFAVDAASVLRRLRADSRIKAAAIHVALPGTVRLDIVERQPRVALVVGGQYASLGDDLVAVALAPSPGGLPEVIDRTGSVPWVRVGARVASRGARIALETLPLIPPALRADLARITVLPGPDLVLGLRSGLEIRAGGPAGLDERLRQVPRVLDALRGEGVSITAVDLRYAGSIAVTLATGRRSIVGVE
jgi:cell division septal protein FtsQ